MRKDLLKAAEIQFFTMYPGGFDHPDMEIIKKKHKVGKMHDMAVDMFESTQFGFIDVVIDNIIKITSRSSMISVFEKPKYKDFLLSLDSDLKEIYVNGLYELLHGDRENGFNTMLSILSIGKLAKWSLISIIPYYYHPQTEVFMKPTTVKGIIHTFDLEGLVYQPRPSFDFYEGYKVQFLEMRQLVNENLGPDNAAFSGFLMMIMDKDK